MALASAYGITTRSRVEEANLAVPAGSREECTSRVPSETLDGVRVSAKRNLRALRAGEVPDLDDMVARGGREDVVRGRVEEDVADTTRGDIDAGNGVKVLGLPAILSPALERGGLDGPDEGLAVLAGGGDDSVVEGGPVSVKDGAGVAAGEGDEVRELGGEAVLGKGGGEGEDGECAAAGRVPVEGDVPLRQSQCVGRRRERGDGRWKRRRCWCPMRCL